jgi:hypothetical protein
VQGYAPDAAVRKITQGVMVAWGELAIKLRLLPGELGEQAHTSLMRQQTGSSSSELIMHNANRKSMSSESMPFLSPSSMLHRSGDTDSLGPQGAVCSSPLSSSSEPFLHHSSNFSSPVFGRSIQRGGGYSDSGGESDRLSGGSGGDESPPRWVSTSTSFTVHGNRASVNGVSSGGVFHTEGIEFLWRAVAQGVSERAEEILNQSGTNAAGGPLEVRYRVKQR